MHLLSRLEKIGMKDVSSMKKKLKEEFKMMRKIQIQEKKLKMMLKKLLDLSMFIKLIY